MFKRIINSTKNIYTYADVYYGNLLKKATIEHPHTYVHLYDSKLEKKCMMEGKPFKVKKK